MTKSWPVIGHNHQRRVLLNLCTAHFHPPSGLFSRKSSKQTCAALFLKDLPSFFSIPCNFFTFQQWPPRTVSVLSLSLSLSLSCRSSPPPPPPSLSLSLLSLLSFFLPLPLPLSLSLSLSSLSLSLSLSPWLFFLSFSLSCLAFSLPLSLVILSLSLSDVFMVLFSSSLPPVTPKFDAFSSEVRQMERETKKPYDTVRILRSLELATTSHRSRTDVDLSPSLRRDRCIDYDVQVVTIFVFNGDGTLAGCLGEFFP